MNKSMKKMLIAKYLYLAESCLKHGEEKQHEEYLKKIIEIENLKN
jgi:hypothetical protein